MSEKSNKTTKMWLRAEEWKTIKSVIEEKIRTNGMVTGKALRDANMEFHIFSPYAFWISKESFREIEARPFPDGGDGFLIEIEEPFGTTTEGWKKLDPKDASDDENKKAKASKGLENLKTALLNFDPVSKPSHYTEGRKYEPRKVIHDWGLNFNLGNAVKYISRAGRKNDAIEDLRKAIQYIEFELEELENEKK